MYPPLCLTLRFSKKLSMLIWGSNTKSPTPTSLSNDILSGNVILLHRNIRSHLQSRIQQSFNARFYSSNNACCVHLVVVNILQLFSNLNGP